MRQAAQRRASGNDQAGRTTGFMDGDRRLIVALCLVAVLPAGCRPASGPGRQAVAGATAAATTAAAPEGTPTIVRRARPTASPTAVDPLAPVAVKELPGIVVPAGATLVRFSPATPDADASADFRLAGADGAALGAWFQDQLPALGWERGDDLDGALLFLHGSQLSARHAGEGLKRSATILFAPGEEIDFTLIVEAPMP